jgi:hypothetical protein
MQHMLFSQYWCLVTVHYFRSKGTDTPVAIREGDMIFQFSLTDNFDPSLNFPNI